VDNILYRFDDTERDGLSHISRQITYYSDDRSQENKMAGYITHLGEKNTHTGFWLKKNERMRLIGRT
jgi:ribosomal protein S17E